MKRQWVGLAFGIVGALGAAQAMAAETIVQFNGGIGVEPFSIGNGAPVQNMVFGVPPGGQPWVIRSLHASIRADGTINAKGSGLLFAGGNVIGTRGPITQVMATLFCGGTASNSGPAELDTTGNFTIRGALTPAPQNPCTQPVLLIRSAAGSQAWFAAGIPLTDDD